MNGEFKTHTDISRLDQEGIVQTEMIPAEQTLRLLRQLIEVDPESLSGVYEKLSLEEIRQLNTRITVLDAEYVQHERRMKATVVPSIESIGMQGKLVGALRRAGITTVDLLQYVYENNISISGIGPKSKQVIAAALEVYREKQMTDQADSIT
ncbi:MAG: hypothetical protein M1607_01440 [Patescibacteria group bacterium]|nr:hypothetical protein [Patescibacteria group bacterium]